ncbi:hypothetical protein Lepto7375DRAFT_3103 [Leptolyngbya sp. PCC 7375]|nr:hypothetical protein Lepto7375DRAFT_3103 [Leptolyngbya sp. PCC 7375]
MVVVLIGRSYGITRLAVGTNGLPVMDLVGKLFYKCVNVIPRVSFEDNVC